MRTPIAALLLLATACQGTAPEGPRPPEVPGPAPDVPRVASLPAGTLVAVRAAATAPDEPAVRAVVVWVREALRQSEHFDVLDAECDLPGAVTVQIAVDAAAKALSAAAKLPDGTTSTLAGASFARGEVPSAVDRLAWAVRRALGDDGPAAVPVAACVSPDGLAAVAATDAGVLLRDGAVAGARRALQNARARDGSSPFVLDALAAVALLRGEAVEAERLALEALRYGARLSPDTQHRLARTLLLARASLRPETAPQRDRELRQLGETFARERPHDPQGRLSEAIACNFLREFAAAKERLEPLAARFPQQAMVAYHLGWACLGTGDGRKAAAWFAEAALRLPLPWTVVPRAVAMRAAGDDEALEKALREWLADDACRRGTLEHELLRMQAAHALLRGDREAAVASLRADLDWLCAHPAELGARGGEFAEQGEVLVRLGHGELLPPRLAAVQAQLPGTSAADACAFLSGMVQVAQTGERALAVERQLGRGGDSAFALRVEAFGHERRGEVGEQLEALGRAARLCDTPLVKAQLAMALRTSGNVEAARTLRETLRAELVAVDLRRRPMHPLLGPELAMAFLLE